MKLARPLKHRIIAAGALIAAMIAPGAPLSAQPVMPGQEIFQSIAERLLNGLGATKFSDIPAIGGYGRPRIAVVPFAAEGKDISPAMAAELNSRLLAELTRRGGGVYQFVARDSLKAVIRDIDSLGEPDSGEGDHVKELLRNARVDVVIVGRLFADARGYQLSYQAVSVEDGTLFAATEPYFIPRAPGMVAAATPETAPPPTPLPEPAPLPPVAAAPLAPVEVTAPPAPRRLDTIQETQRWLALLGYRPGPVDGVMHPATRRAIRTFQRDVGLAVNGRLTRQVLRELRIQGRRADLRL